MPTTFACDMTALTAEQRAAHSAVIGQLFGAVREIRHVGAGYRFVLELDHRTLDRIAQFIALERRCCPFFDFTVGVPAEVDHAEFAITGPDGVHHFIQAEFSAHLPEAVQFPAGA